MSIIIRKYEELTDSQAVGILIAQTYSKYNLDFALPNEQEKLLGPFSHAWSDEQSHRDAIIRVLRTEMVFIAEEGGEIVGVCRCKAGRLQSLFVSGNYHRQGIGRKLVERCEQWCISMGARVIRLAATLYAVPFYQAVGYKRSTGIRNGWSFDGRGLKYQPMKKVL